MNQDVHLVRFGPFVLDSRSGDLRRRSRKTRLSPQPLQLLQLLLRRAGELVAIEEIRQTLWPDQEFVDAEHGVGIAIKKLRDALGDDPAHPVYIETIRRRGYRFISDVTFEAPPTQNSPHHHVVGRAPQLEEMHDCLRRVLQQERQILFVSGEAGIGKTTLVDEFVRQAISDHSSIHIARGQCVDGYGGQEADYPMLDALTGLCRPPRGDRFIECLAALAPTWLVHFPSLLKRSQRERLQQEVAGATRGRMLREIEEALQAITATNPLLLIFEDLQWSDSATVDLISVLARHRAPARFMLICTMRPLESDLPLNMIKQDLLIHRLARKIAVGPLSEAEVGEYLARESSNGPVPRGLTEAVYRQCEGNPLFMIATLEHMTIRGALTRDDRGWQVRQPLDQIALEVPESLQEMIELQIDRLSADEQKALEVASVEGVCFSAVVCAAAADLEPQAVDDLCADLARRHHMIRPVAPKRCPNETISTAYEFVHALYREVLYRRQTVGRRAALHHRIGEKLQSLFGDDTSQIAAELADHFEKALDWQRAVHYLRIAADNAIQRWLPLKSAATLEHALDLVHRFASGDRAKIEIEILEKIAAMYVSASSVRAIGAYETLIACAAREGLIETEVLALTRMAFPLSWISAGRCLETIERALALSAEVADPILRATTRASCHALRLLVGPWDPNDRDEFRKAFVEIERSGDPVLMAMYRIEESTVLFAASEYRASYNAAVDGLATLAGMEAAASPDGREWVGHTCAAWCLVFLGEWGEAMRAIESAVVTAGSDVNSGAALNLRLLQTCLHLFALDFEGARALAASLLEAAEDHGDAMVRLARTLSGAAEAGLGNRERALEVLAGVREDMQRQPLIRDSYWRLFLESSLGEMWLAGDDLDRAREHAGRFLETAAAMPDRTWHALAWDLQARLALAAQDRERAHVCVHNALDSIAGIEAPLAAWRVHATAAEIEPATDDAKEHCAKSRATILHLASSLEVYGRLQRTFLLAPAVRKILGS